MDLDARLYRSDDGVTWTPTASPPTFAGPATVDGQVVIARPGEPEVTEQCRPGAVNADGSPVTTIAPSPCRYPMSFDVVDSATGAVTATSGVVFRTSETGSSLTQWPDGLLALSREGTAEKEWASSDGIAWAGSDVPLGTGGPSSPPHRTVQRP